MVVMLVYEKSEEPVTLILHGNDGQTRVSIAETSNQNKNISTITGIRNALEGKPPTAI